MVAFRPILDEALRRVGAQALEDRLVRILSPDELRAQPDAYYLSLMSLRTFRARLKHSVVDARWPAFEQAFQGFEPGRVCAMTDEDLDRLLKDTRLIRHGGKMRAVRDNAAVMLRVRDSHGGMGPYLADWPVSDTVGLWVDLGKRFSQMGGNSAPAFLRMAGRDTFMLTDAVVRALNQFGAWQGVPKTQKDRLGVQAVMNAFAAESGRPLAHVSQILAMSVD